MYIYIYIYIYAYIRIYIGIYIYIYTYTYIYIYIYIIVRLLFAKRCDFGCSLWDRAGPSRGCSPGDRIRLTIILTLQPYG